MKGGRGNGDKLIQPPQVFRIFSFKIPDFKVVFRSLNTVASKKTIVNHLVISDHAPNTCQRGHVSTLLKIVNMLYANPNDPQ